MFPPSLRFAAVGHVTNDRLSDGEQPGGSVVYATLAAAALGVQAEAVTSCGPDFLGRAALASAGVRLCVRPAERTTSFENLYEDGVRRDRLLALAPPLRGPAPEADVVFACPVFGEVADEALVPNGAILGAGLQGWLRATDEAGWVVRKRPGPLEAFARCRAIFVSEDDLGEEQGELLPALCRTSALVVLTRGRRGSVVFERGVPHPVAPVAAKEVDPTGAGDVYAACFLLALASGRAPVVAGELASRAAAHVVEAPGPTSLLPPSRLLERLTRAG